MGAAARRRRTAALCRRGRGPPSRARRLAGYRTAPPPSRRLDRPCRPDPVAGGVLPARSASLRTGWKTGSGLKNHLARREKPFSISCLRACSLLTRAGRQKRREGSQQGDARAASELRVTVYRIRRDHGARMTMSASGGGPDQEPHRRPGHNLARRSIEALPRGREVSVRSARELHCVCQKEGGAFRRRLKSRSVGFLYTVWLRRRRRPSQPSPMRALPSKVSEAGSGTGTSVVCAEKLIMAPVPSVSCISSVIEYGEARVVIALLLP